MVNDVAEILYTADAPFVPWDKALDDDRRHYLLLAQAALEVLADDLDNKNDSFGGALGVAIALIRAEVEVSRLRQRSYA